jgi:hypothetical protein
MNTPIDLLRRKHSPKSDLFVMEMARKYEIQKIKAEKKLEAYLVF